MTTNKAYPQYIGKPGIVHLLGLDVPVQILNHRYVFGRDDLEVRAVGGKLSKWVAAESVKLTNQN